MQVKRIVLADDLDQNYFEIKDRLVITKQPRYPVGNQFSRMMVLVNNNGTTGWVDEHYVNGKQTNVADITYYGEDFARAIGGQLPQTSEFEFYVAICAKISSFNKVPKKISWWLPWGINAESKGWVNSGNTFESLSAPMGTTHHMSTEHFEVTYPINYHPFTSDEETGAYIEPSLLVKFTVNQEMRQFSSRDEFINTLKNETLLYQSPTPYTGVELEMLYMPQDVVMFAEYEYRTGGANTPIKLTITPQF